MEKNNESYLYSFFISDSPLYLDNNLSLDIINEYPIFELNSKNSDDIYDSLESFINNSSNSKRSFLVIYTDDINPDSQVRLIPLVKDRTYKTLDLPSNCKIIVIGKTDNMNKELLGLLTVL